MANSNFNVDAIMKDIKKKALDEMKRRMTDEINKLARGTGERPQIRFTPKGDSSLDVKVEGVSEELKIRVEDWLKKQK
jgi:hypothetical protein